MEPKRLYRSVRDRMLLGVCGGIGEYFGVDATIIRVVWALFGCTGAGILAYFIAAVIMPQNPEN
ncbi:PspC domain-containing protein [Qiania dongpingensis]|uniref:PspC domain-containing protein n=1 Tax=Qiania dongpingensis TaxID=2763669 RepID=A0A7G9G331_9FIRM|nr:PspC domain-containing protein [Qiania dongpingensis]QNM05213.1 PspC domain-containing protein [Qiania dongpingensis]